MEVDVESVEGEGAERNDEMSTPVEREVCTDEFVEPASVGVEKSMGLVYRKMTFSWSCRFIWPLTPGVLKTDPRISLSRRGEDLAVWISHPRGGYASPVEH